MNRPTILPLLAATALAGQPHPPKEPVVSEPVLRPVTRRTQPPAPIPGPELPCRIAFAGSVSTNDALLLPGRGTVSLVTLQGRSEIPWHAIDRIVFRRWKGQEVRRNEWRFLPSETEVFLKDGSRLLCVEDIPELRQPLLRDRRGTRRVYSYFFDRRQAGRWAVTGGKDWAHPERHPAAGCVVFIDLL